MLATATRPSSWGEPWFPLPVSRIFVDRNRYLSTLTQKTPGSARSVGYFTLNTGVVSRVVTLTLSLVRENLVSVQRY